MWLGYADSSVLVGFGAECVILVEAFSQRARSWVRCHMFWWIPFRRVLGGRLVTRLSSLCPWCVWLLVWCVLITAYWWVCVPVAWWWPCSFECASYLPVGLRGSLLLAGLRHILLKPESIGYQVYGYSRTTSRCCRCFRIHLICPVLNIPKVEVCFERVETDVAVSIPLGSTVSRKMSPIIENQKKGWVGS